MAGKLRPLSDPDEQLVRDYRLNESQDTLARLYLRYSDMVYLVAVKDLKDPHKARDAVMNIYEELVEKLKQHEVTQFRSWLHVLTRNHCLMQLRREKTAIVTELTDEFMQSGSDDHPDEAWSTEAALSQLENCIEKLASNQQRIIRLFYLQERS